ncbi:hypothetical protein SDC9_161393 [bioreactor metagenome]|uniref:Outer membrane protein beta-barrel domain-containing protein n=1 Tax=bioreactor metagenome TaxID=1076179 RepID=A0A645FI77_9ZZZZ
MYLRVSRYNKCNEMIKRLLILTLGLSICGLTYAQDQSDKVYRSTRLVPRFGINGQKGYGIEAGLYLNQFYTRPPYSGTTPPYSSSGFYLSSEISLSDFKKVIIGPKIGWELSVIGGTHGSFFGAEFINYTDFDKYSPALMLKIGIPLMWLNVGYGYTMFFENSLKDRIGKHRFTASYTINRKANQAYKRLQKNLSR